MSDDYRVDDFPIVVIYLNNRIPKYATKNIEYLTKTFAKKRIVLVSNIEANKNSIPTGKNAEFYLLNNFDEELARVTAGSELPNNFRNGFWISTIARFKALEIFMRNDGVTSALHIEADVLLLSNFPFKCEAFRSAKLAFPYVSERTAAASIFFVGNISTLINFNEFIEISIKSEPSITDMRILAKFGEANSNKVTRLFSGFGDYEKHCENHIFDGATFGMYLTGQDPRNSRGFVKTYFDIADHSLTPSQVNFKYLGNEALVKLENKNYILTNLHIHSKQRKYFSYKRTNNLIRKAIEGSGKGGRVSFYAEAWLGLVTNYLNRRIRNLS
jgi:hypothetical protein